ncbi:MAG: hypothetical protein Q8M02_00080 [Candidatus Didemnitutus sp.]|nr:hypothetical protein [Candidatus Didemnitutus sp.]
MRKIHWLLALVLFGAVFATAPAQPKRPADKNAAKAAPTIEGMEIKRGDGTYLGLTLLDGKFKLTFYDKEKEPMQANVIRVVARWPNVHGPGHNRTVLLPAGDGTFLHGAQFVRPPHAFKLYLILVAVEGSNETENINVDFRG